MLKKLIKLYEKYSKSHFFRVRCDYIKNRNVLYSFNITISCQKKEAIVYGTKEIKSLLVKKIPSQILCNGKIHIEPLCYLGKFRRKEEYKQYN